MATLPANLTVPYERTDDPSQIGWPVTLPIEIALRTAPNDEIRQAYGYSPVEWAALKDDPRFLADLAKAVEVVSKEGMSFKLKAQLQAEEMLKESWRLVHDPNCPATVRADLIKATARWAGYDVKDQAAGGSAPTLAIQINLG